MSDDPKLWLPSEPDLAAEQIVDQQPGLSMMDRLRAAARLSVAIQEARRSPLGLYKLAFSARGGKPIFVKWFHEEWNDIFMSERNFLIEGARGITKCRVAGQRILMADGQVVVVESLVGGVRRIISYDQSTGAFSPDNAVVKKLGRRRTRKISTWSGRVQHLTCNEKVLTQRGWVRADGIRAGDFLAHVRKSPEPEVLSSVGEDEAYLIGLLMGDGGCTGSSIRLSCGDQALLRRLKPILSRLRVKIRKVKGANVDWHLSGAMLPIARRHGLHRKTSHTKRVSPLIFGATTTAVRAFLAGYWDADGTYPRKGHWIDFSSRNEKLLEDTQTLLARIGRASLLRKCTSSYRGKKVNSYRLYLHGPEAGGFLKEVPVISTKGELARKNGLFYLAGEGGAFTTTMGLPLAFLEKTMSLFGNRWLRKNGAGSFHRYRTVRRSRVERIASAIERFSILPRTDRLKSRAKARYSAPEDLVLMAKDLRSALNAPIWWDRVTSISDGGQREVYAISSEKNQTFVGEGCVSHNTTFLTACLLWTIGHERTIRVTWLSSNDPQASKRLRAAKKHIDTNQLLQATFPGLSLSKSRHDTNSATMLTVERKGVFPEPTIEASGVLSTGTGNRVDILALDDIVDHRNSLLYPALRPKVLSKLQSDWMGCIDEEKGRIIAIYNSWHEEDAHAWLEEHAGWKHKTYSHGKGDNIYYSIFPELFPEERLKRLYVEEGPIAYARGRRCMRTTADTVSIVQEALVPYGKTTLTKGEVQQASIVVSLDPSSGRNIEKGKVDYLGLCITMFIQKLKAGKPVGYKICVPEAFATRLRTRQQAVLALEMVKRWRPDAVLVEAEGLANLDQWLVDMGGLPEGLVWPISVGNQSKGQRLESVTPFFYPPEGCPTLLYFHPKLLQVGSPEEHRVLSDGTPYEASYSLRHQMLHFPTQHDDVLDALVQSLIWIRTNLAPDTMDLSFTDQGHVEVDEICLDGRPTKTQQERDEEEWMDSKPRMPTIEELDALYQD